MSTEAMPPLPEPTGFVDDDGDAHGQFHGPMFTRTQMHAYARTYAADLERRLQEAGRPAALTDERIDHIADIVARGMPDGIHGFCKTWGWQQFARALLSDCAGHYRSAPSAAAAAGKE